MSGRQRALAIEGLPGAGKTSLVSSLCYVLPDAKVVPEIVLCPPPSPGRDFFVANDLVKEQIAAPGGTVVMDRCWLSTVAYVVAESRWAGRRADVVDVVTNLYKDLPTAPSTCLFIDSPRALMLSFAPDGLFPDLRFRLLLRQSYYECFARLPVSAHVVKDNSVRSARSCLHAVSADAAPSHGRTGEPR
ncbi:hypothetical protein ACWD5V_33895 [Streptomyces sp. NPDC002523]